MCSSIWSCSSEQMLNCSAYCVLNLVMQLFGQPQWFTVKDRSRAYVNKLRVELEKWSCEIRTGCAVKSILTASGGYTIVTETATSDTYDGCIMAAHAPDALKLLGQDATFDETRVLGAFQYVDSDIYLHHDDSLMPKNPTAWGACNFLGVKGERICLTYWLNVIQNLEIDVPFLVTLNPFHLPKNEVMKWSTSHPLPTVASMKASLELSEIQGKRGIWFCGAYQGYGFHEDGLKAGMVAAKGLLGSKCILLDNKKTMTPSLMVKGARLLEEGGTLFEFYGNNNKDGLKSMMKIHSPLFYWKVATEADLGLADAYISGDISFADKEEGLLNLFLVIIAFSMTHLVAKIFIGSRDKQNLSANCMNNGGWWKPVILTSGLASAKFFFQHLSRRNTITQARQNIASHYDLSNKFFSLFLDETMTYSCAIFKEENEDLKVAQMRKISRLITKVNYSTTRY
ncbi:Cyclopropane mycolic acid synthase 3 [Nymphaea thermarum]|nr:Cyclopropane mycolic acid synthase 3 [Nymphaea thermarum]